MLLAVLLYELIEGEASSPRLGSIDLKHAIEGGLKNGVAE